MTRVSQGAPYRSALLPIPRFGVEVRAVAVGRAVFFPVRGICGALGLNHRTQRARLQADSRFNDGAALRDLPVLTSQGYRDTLCIHKAMLGAWLAQIDPTHCKRASTRELLAGFQAELFTAADRFLFGPPGAVGASSQAARTAEAATSAPAPYLITGLLHVGPCPHCGAALCLILDETGAHLTPESESEE